VFDVVAVVFPAVDAFKVGDVVVEAISVLVMDVVVIRDRAEMVFPDCAM
jgi:hypothetical protein